MRLLHLNGERMVVFEHYLPSEAQIQGSKKDADNPLVLKRLRVAAAAEQKQQQHKTRERINNET